MPEKILIVDDDLDSLKLIGLMLQRHGYEVVAASAGNQALAKASSDHPDLIILDVMMPDMNGYEVCRRLRANSATKTIPIIMFTAKTLIDDKVAGFEAGADDYLTKPTHPAELASRVKAILQRNASQRTKTVDRGLSIGVIGAKGGIGTSTFALNIGAAFKRLEQNPIVADFRLGSGSLALYLGLGRISGIGSLLSKPAGEITPKLIEQELAVHQTGLRILPASIRAKETMMNFQAETAQAVVRGLRQLGRPVIFDLGSGFTTLTSCLIPEMDHLIVLIEPSNVTISMARELLQEISREDKSQISVVVVNRVQNNLQPAWHEVEGILNHEIRATIAAAPELAFQATEATTPMVIYQPNAIVSTQFLKFAEELNSLFHD